ncbi:peptidyl-prolyl cis-trans isomerase [Bacillus timonensis]|nr:peptidyl-prolyl cis-trans isomerase [Bacillus timonensis]
MESIVTIEGNVQFTITLDPGVWIFDDRKVDLTTYFDELKTKEDELSEYTKEISAHWDREIREGAVYPPTLKTERKFQKEKILTGSFGIPLLDFVQNAKPNNDVKTLIIQTKDEQHSFPFNVANTAILGFSSNGKPLNEDGPVHFYLGDGSNKDAPIKNVKKIIIE